MQNEGIEGVAPTQGQINENGSDNNEGLTSRLDDSIGLSEKKLRNSEIKELTFS
ncbi:hypothetical protein [Desulfosporosinus youngiae]|uniref:Uncharacterized protein n=1 Tax=Desulfosporosinus youngiae DSM 17734 TaxID=768710 RepID=H5Y0P7_9FIRM|nr:hypothetical protein [Desulfosporosinus youngiae]EHQ92303.1 hypothetical protein DesyoDRAFT_5375 [Desulfosporosinus youngiae DSM 17734]